MKPKTLMLSGAMTCLFALTIPIPLAAQDSQAKRHHYTLIDLGTLGGTFSLAFSINIVSSDKQGRIVLPDEQCKLLNLRSEVVLVGNYSRFEIWSPESWQKAMEEDAPTFSYLLGRVGI
jgi:hypothetical protein